MVWGIQGVLKSLTKASCRFTNVLLIKLHSLILRPVNHSTFLCHGISVLVGNQEVFECIASFEMNLHSQLVTYYFETFTYPFGVGYYHVDVFVLVAVCLLHVVIVTGAVVVLMLTLLSSVLVI